MKVDIQRSNVSIDVSSAEADRINQGPTPVRSQAQRATFAENVVRAMGLTPSTVDYLKPVVRGKRGVSNSGFKAWVVVEAPKSPVIEGDICGRGRDAGVHRSSLAAGWHIAQYDERGICQRPAR